MTQETDNTPLVRGKGFFLAIIGPDGSGKTTIAEEVMNVWKEKSNRAPFYVHGHFGIFPRLRCLRRLLAWLMRRQLASDPDYTKRHSGANVTPHSLPRSLLYLGYYYWEYIFGHFKIFEAKSENRLIVADRYFYDYFFQRGNMKLPHSLLRFLCCFIPKPDLIVFLDVDPATIYARKNELTVQEIVRQQKSIEQICKWLPGNVKIDASDGIDITVHHVTEAMMSKIEERNR